MSGRTFLPLQGRDLLDLLIRRLLLPTPSRGSGDLKVRCRCGSGRTCRYGRCRPFRGGDLNRKGRFAPSQGHLRTGLLRTSRGRCEAPLKNHSYKKQVKLWLDTFFRLTVVRRLQVGSRNAFGRPEDPVLPGKPRGTCALYSGRTKPEGQATSTAARGPPRKRRRAEKKRVRVNEGRTRAPQPQAEGEFGQEGLPRSGGILSHNDPRGLSTPRAVFTYPTVVRSDLVSRSSGVRRGRICRSGLYSIVVILGRDVLTIRVGHRKFPIRDREFGLRSKVPTSIKHG
nr:hypothetical protein Iba_chr09aCG12610 [Ipomoea batatas]